MAKKEKKTLEQILLDYKVLAKEQVDSALMQCQNTGKPLKEILITAGLLAEEKLAPFLAEQLDIPFLNLNSYIIHPDIVASVPESIAKKYKIFPVFKIKNLLTIAMADPLDFHALDALKRSVKYEIKPVMALAKDIAELINKYYGISGVIEDVLKGMDISALTREMKEKGETPENLKKIISEAPIIKLVDLVIEDGVRRGASDIHLEPEENKLATRTRVDGVLHESVSLPKMLQEAIISRIKIMAELDIAQRRMPQDGKILAKVLNKEIDLRVSTYPGPYGEDVVLRILDKSTALVGLEKLGFSQGNLKMFESLILSPNGIVLVTGPTGSGKTTTLYSALNRINTPEKMIITIEDPIEYQMKGIRQSQINPKAGFTFASGLRSILRHDPNVIMVGEIRDIETAETAVQAALTGHLVLSTLHTNDAPSAVTRLIDMGIEPFLIASSVLGVMAQRLIRIICERCKESYKPSSEIINQFNLPKAAAFYRGRGCNSCINTGYSGRIMVGEIMILSDKIKELVLQRSSSSIIKDTACKEGMITMRQDGINKVLAGITTIEEVLRVT